MMLGRAFSIDNDPAPAVAAVKSGFRIYPYAPGASGTAVATFLAGKAPLSAPAERPGTTFVDAVHLAVNTIAPNDFSYWELIDELVQQEPAGAGDHDRQTHSMLQTEQPMPTVGSQSGTVEENPDGSADIDFGPAPPAGRGSDLHIPAPRVATLGAGATF
jgi:hypothetical protein